jgi:hypothetical protein
LSYHFVQELLNSGYRILIYSGQLDIIVANSLTQALVDSLQWNGKEEFVQVKKTVGRSHGDAFPPLPMDKITIKTPNPECRLY